MLFLAALPRSKRQLYASKRKQRLRLWLEIAAKRLLRQLKDLQPLAQDAGAIAHSCHERAAGCAAWISYQELWADLSSAVSAARQDWGWPQEVM
jgi:hypothetical protein